MLEYGREDRVDIGRREHLGRDALDHMALGKRAGDSIGESVAADVQPVTRELSLVREVGGQTARDRRDERGTTRQPHRCQRGAAGRHADLGSGEGESEWDVTVIAHLTSVQARRRRANTARMRPVVVCAPF